MSWILFAAEAAPTAAEVAETVVANSDKPWYWQMAAAFLGGVVATKLAGWVSGFIEGKAKEWIVERLSNLEERIDQTGIGSQIQADNAVINILKECLPEMMQHVTAEVIRDLKDGKLDEIKLKSLAQELAEIAKGHIEGGKHDYLKNSSYKDLQTVAEWVIKNWFGKKKLEAA